MTGAASSVARRVLGSSSGRVTLPPGVCAAQPTMVTAVATANPNARIFFMFHVSFCLVCPYRRNVFEKVAGRFEKTSALLRILLLTFVDRRVMLWLQT